VSGDQRTPSSGVSTTDLLSLGEIELLGLLPYSSNYAFLVEVARGDEKVKAVYKPVKGERPLWDFPHGTLALREVAAALVSDAGGFGLVPPTVLRDEAPHGPGSLQLFIDHDPNRHYFVLIHEREREMADFAAFDIVINNADRKGGHVIEDLDGKLWGLDHGLAFHLEPKLRTVVWAFAGQPLPEEVSDRLSHLLDAFERGSLSEDLAGLLTADEIAETQARIEVLTRSGVFPEPQGPFHMPWPLV
jgi:hypothetical protein